MAKAKSKPSPKAKPQSALEQQIAQHVVARLEAENAHIPEGAAAGLLNLRKLDFGKLVPILTSKFVQVAGIALDGRVDANEAIQIGEMIVDVIKRIRESHAAPAA